MATPLTLQTLRDRSATVLKLPAAAQALIAHYRDLQIMAGHTVCPYHINCRLFSKDRALVGKGRPEEIEATAERFFKQFHTTVHPDDSQKLQTSLRDYGLGIDCSGFVAWVLNEATLKQYDVPIWKCLEFAGTKRRVISRFRPLESISAALLTGERNAHTVAKLHEVRPGDMIRALNGGHVIVVTEVGLDAKARAQYFRYAHSTAGNEQWSGVQQGVVLVTKPTGALADQRWIEGGLPVAPALAAVRLGGTDSRIVRLKTFVELDVRAHSP